MTTKWLWLLVVASGCGFGDNHLYNRTTTDICGDGTVTTSEGCDDGNTNDGDGCSATCALEVQDPVCGNGAREVGEACDDGNTQSSDGCSATCAVESVCGNGTREMGEACDDGNIASGDGCSPTCVVESATACGLVPQSGCSGGTPACDLDGDGGTVCRGVTAQGGPDDLCPTLTACKPGFTCAGVEGAAQPWCAQFCIDDGDCTGPGSRCVIDLVDENGQPSNVSVCSNSCNPVTQTGCPTGSACFASSADFTSCDISGTVPEGGACTQHMDCRAGTACIGSSGGGTRRCLEYCVVGNNATCAPGKTCGGLVNEIIIGGVEYGVCD